ncbi:YqeG family HAD IIIA-type phosphatase [Sulfobacillus harzensis]|uniref:YqeG family HAD IIIA-type phosphatase n=1 Tax=Sulfobacillus harzensis TaxID=2729629 RepID=A0A7Y0L1T2_9FIRM|nr:YqeG family HAD IIIA-type phosphatase [Sulfobacillus harzensis]NMP21176.1 YqeG family HAD IIIA-type phosphatase [Sulfobacillus harzensis]
MIDILQPRLFVQSIYDIDLSRLTARGVKGLILDLDNTLVGWNQPNASEELMDWLMRVRQYELQTCIVSNNLSDRVESFSREVGVMAIAKAAKPRRRAFRQAMRKMGTHHRETAVVGDQVFTDILGGNRLNLFTILVRPMNEREYWATKVVRRVERMLLPDREPLSMTDNRS